MSHWEDIVKERLERYESTLPEDSLASFHAFRGGQTAKTGRPVYPWILGVMAIAAGVSAVLFIHRQEPVVNMVPAEHTPPASLEARAVLSEVVPSEPFIHYTAQTLPSVEVPTEIVQPASEAFDEGTVESEEVVSDTVSAQRLERAGTLLSPYVSQDVEDKFIRMKVGPVAGVVAGSGVTAFMATSLLNGRCFSVSGGVTADKPVYTSSPGNDAFSEENLRHRFPLIVGMTFWIPVSDRLNVMTGLEYSQYVSRIGTSSSVGKKQVAQYIGIPLRLDWMLSSSDRIKTYLGGGWGVDYCFRATQAGESLAKGGIDFYLMGAGGIQLNVGRRVGLYVEPRVGWTVLNGNKTLETYRTVHAPMLSVTSGIRIKLGE